MDKELQKVEIINGITDLKSAIGELLPRLQISEEKANEIKKLLAGNADYQNLQTIMDILISISTAEKNEDIRKLLDMLYF